MSEIKTLPKPLVALHPAWGAGTFFGIVRHGVAVTFDCPCGTPPGCECGLPDCALKDAPGCTFSRLTIWFENPIDGLPKLNAHPGQTLWHRQGDTFETLTLQPSIHAVGHWHGWLRDGVLVSC